MNRGFRPSHSSLHCSARCCRVLRRPHWHRTSSTSPCASWSGFPAGGTADLIARVVADKLKDSLGVPVIVDNRPGAIGRIAAEAVKTAAPDGTTIMVMPIGPMAVVPHSTKNLNYDPLKDFTPIALGATFQFAIAAGPESGAKNWQEFAAWVKANPDKAAFATSGAGSLPHFFGLLLSTELGVPDAARRVQGLGGVHQRSDRRAGSRRHRRDGRSYGTASQRQDPHPCRVGRQALDGAARGADVQGTRPDRRRSDRLVRILRTGEHAEAHRRCAEPRHQQGAAVARPRREAVEDRHGSGDQHAGRNSRESSDWTTRSGVPWSRLRALRPNSDGRRSCLSSWRGGVPAAPAAGRLRRSPSCLRRTSDPAADRISDSRTASPRSSASTRTASAATAARSATR